MGTNNFKIVKFIGEGGYAAVFEVEHKVTGEKAAMKVIPKVNN